jgi:hypothetical protein
MVQQMIIGTFKHVYGHIPCPDFWIYQISDNNFLEITSAVLST